MDQDIFKEKLNKLIYNSELNDDQKILWNFFIKHANADEIEAVYEAANSGHDSLVLLTEHLHSKIKEMKEMLNRNKK